MKANYSFLKDELALLEIRKHKWIESEKVGTEIGFATAAVDWISKYGMTWKQFRLDAKEVDNVYTEKRRYRRFAFQFPLQLKAKGQSYCSFTNDISLIGLSCPLPVSLSNGTEAEVTLRLPKEAAPTQKINFNFASKVLRISLFNNKKSNLCYKVFLPFNESFRDFLRSHSALFEIS